MEEYIGIHATFETDWHATNQFLQNEIVDIPFHAEKLHKTSCQMPLAKWSKRCGHWDLIGIRRSALQWLRRKKTLANHAFIISFSSIMSIDGKPCERTPESMAFVIDLADSASHHVLFAILSPKNRRKKRRRNQKKKTIAIYLRRTVSAHLFEFRNNKKFTIHFWLWPNSLRMYASIVPSHGASQRRHTNAVSGHNILAMANKLAFIRNLVPTIGLQPS